MKRPTRAAQQPAPGLPPHSVETERAALGCVLLAGIDETPLAYALAGRMMTSLFYVTEHRTLLEAIHEAKRALRPVSPDAIADRLKTAGRLEDLGGLTGLVKLTTETPSPHNFGYYLEQLQDLTKRREAVRIAREILDLTTTASPEDFALKLQAAREGIAAAAGDTTSKEIEFLSVKELKAFEPDPSTYLIGDDAISKGAITVFAGWGGLGKSRLATTLAFAGAIGKGQWMGYDVRRQFRTAILQSENSKGRAKSEVQDFPDHVEDWIRYSAPADLNFSSATFRSALTSFYERWPFDCLVVDPWMDISGEGAQDDVTEAFRRIWSCLPKGDKAPAVIIVAHTRKMGRTDKWQPRKGRELASDVSGSHAVVSKARAAFFLQPGSLDPQDPTVVFDCGKSNNFKPRPASAWIRANGSFEPCEDFDFKQYYNPPDSTDDGRIEIEDMRKVFFGHNKRMATRSVIIKELKALKFSSGNCYNAWERFSPYLFPQGDPDKRATLWSWIEPGDATSP